MNIDPNNPDFSSLTKAQRIMLAESLWNSVCDERGDAEIPASHRQELESRLSAYEKGEIASQPWEEVQKELREKS